MDTNSRLINIYFRNCLHSEEPIATILDPSMTLEEIREKLSQCDENGKFIMKFDMKFCNKGGPYEIPKSDEANIYLYEILSNNNNLGIKRNENVEEIMPRLIKEKKLDCGIQLTKNGPIQSDNVAFKFKEPKFFRHPTGSSRSEVKKDRKEFCENGIEWKADLKMSW